jgi:hypothetical protein
MHFRKYIAGMLRTNRVQLLWLLAGLSVLAPFLYLGWHGIAASDDYIDYKLLSEYGFWGALKNYYLHWSGRYVSYALAFIINPLHIGEKAGPAILNTLALTLLFVLAHLQAKILNHLFQARYKTLPITILIICFWLMYVPKPVELLFWFTGAMAYLPGLLGMSYWVFLHLKEKSKIQNTIYVILPFFIAGTSEINVLLMAFIMVLCYPPDITKRKFYLIPIAVFILGASLELFSPGSQVRMAYFKYTAQNPVGDFSFSIQNSLLITWHFIRDWTRSSSLLIVALLISFLLDVSEKIKLSKFQKLVIIAAPSMIPILYFPFFWGTGMSVPPDRLNNVIFLFFTLYVIYVTPIILRPILLKTEIPQLLILIVSIGIFWVGTFQSRLRTALFDIKELPEFTKEIRIREELTRAHFNLHPTDTLVLLPIKHIPYTIFYGDLKSDPTHWYNEGYAYYHGISAVVCDSVEVK